MENKEVKRALDKIQKCLNLSKSTNPHEAARALSQAYALMKKHNISESVAINDDCLDMGNILNIGNVIKLPIHIRALIDVIEKTFSVKTIQKRQSYTSEFGTNIYKSNIVFYGNKNDLVIAEYAFSVLVKILKKERKNFYDTLQFVKNKKKKADQFCIGWCIGVLGAIAHLKRFSNEEQKKHYNKINDYILLCESNIEKEPEPKKKSDFCDINVKDLARGYIKGVNVKIDRGINNDEEKLMSLDINAK